MNNNEKPEELIDFMEVTRLEFTLMGRPVTVTEHTWKAEAKFGQVTNEWETAEQDYRKLDSPSNEDAEKLESLRLKAIECVLGEDDRENPWHASIPTRIIRNLTLVQAYVNAVNDPVGKLQEKEGIVITERTRSDA